MSQLKLILKINNKLSRIINMVNIICLELIKMRNLLKFELQRIFKSRTIYIAILIGVIISLWLLIIELIEVHNFEQAIELYGIDKAGLYYPRSLFNSFIGLEYAYLPSTILYTIFPILVSFPYAISFYYDKKSGYLKNIFIICDKRKYYAVKYVSTFLSGAFITFSILMFSLTISAMFFPMLAPELTTYTFSPQTGSQMWTKLYVTHPMIYTLLYILIDTIFYGIIATLPLLFGLIAKNSFTVVCSPILLYTIAHYILNAIDLSQFSPMGFLRPCQIFVNADFAIILFEAFIIFVITSSSFIFIGGRNDVL